MSAPPVTLTPELNREIIELLAPKVQETLDRRALINNAFGSVGKPSALVDFSGNSQTFLSNLIHTLHHYGEFKPGTPALIALLEEAKELFGNDKQTRIDNLISRLTSPRDQTKKQPPVEQTVTGRAGSFSLLPPPPDRDWLKQLGVRGIAQKHWQLLRSTCPMNSALRCCKKLLTLLMQLGMSVIGLKHW